MATCGVQALDCLKARAYDLVLCDIKMPNQSGDEVPAPCPTPYALPNPLRELRYLRCGR